MATKSEWQDLLRRTPGLAKLHRRQWLTRLFVWSIGGTATASIAIAAIVSTHHSIQRPINAVTASSNVSTKVAAESNANATSDRVGVYDRADPPRSQELQASH